MHSITKETDLLNKVISRNLTSFDQGLFNANKHISRHLCQRNKTFFIMALDNNSEPYIVEELAVDGVSADLTSGLKIFLSGTQSNYEVSSVPQRLGNTDIFAWVPYYDICEYTPKGAADIHNLRVSMCLKQPHAPRLPKLEVPFMADYATTKDMFPQLLA